ncbi:hypothetical protein [Blastococcus sp. Marseille-P5729]|uniref:hypothetical protein n=1 Tax=Blastococcus sp. Marseille-P5729 TaxID=2086582 RepID=UPI000D0E6259|nr:hypothetical protein [Blastococcus sp. Marseille-P5729]
MSVIAFNTEQIADIAAATQAHQGEWDAIWNGVQNKLGGVVSDALDALTGSSLQERTFSYQQKTAVYTQQLMARAQATSNIATIAEQTGYSMVKTLSG